MKKIQDVAKYLNIPSSQLFMYGQEMAKINYKFKGSKKGKLILVTAINPTRYGEGKTTTAIGLTDALNANKQKTIAVLREPSLGPVFGVKGGATGAGESRILPSETINLHFTGDIHAITTVNNLIAAVIDNHIFQGNELGIKEVFWKRAIDMNDRTLRGQFIITAASEIMAIFCLANSWRNLKERLNQIIFGVNKHNQPLKVETLHITDALLVLLKDAINPNLVQSANGSPIVVHGGPFANIAHGASSVIALKQALSLADFVVTEAGFGADLGAEKFFDIVARQGNLNPDVVVLVVTVKALKHQGLGNLSQGLEHLAKHVANLQKFNSNFLVVINKFAQDQKKDLQIILTWCKAHEVPAEVVDVFHGKTLANKSIAALIKEMTHFYKAPNFMYAAHDTFKLKLKKVAQEIYGAKKLVFSAKAEAKLKWIVKHKLDRQFICIAKTPASFSDQAKLLGAPKDFDLHVANLALTNGANFIVAECGKISRLPGLGAKPKVHEISFIGNKISGVA